MESQAISYIRRNRDRILIAHSPGAEVLSRLVESAIVDGVRRADVFIVKGIYALSTSERWLIRDAFDKLIPYPEIAENSTRLEIFVSAFFDWFSVSEGGLEVYSSGQVPEAASLVRKELRYPFALIFGFNSPE